MHGLEDMLTEPLEVRQPTRRQPLLVRFARGLSGASTVGLVLLALVITAFQLLTSLPGPGQFAIWLHLGGAVVAVGLQVAVDRTRGVVFWLCWLGVLVVVGSVLWFSWYQ